MDVAAIIGSFGGTSALARLLGHRNPSTVHGWLKRGTIPARQQAAVLRAASECDLPLCAADLILSDATPQKCGRIDLDEKATGGHRHLKLKSLLTPPRAGSAAAHD